MGQPGAVSYDEVLLWAAATTCFFGFFHAGELTIPTPSAFNSATHLAWGAVSIIEDGRMLRVFLKRSKTDQYGRGVEVFIGSMGDLLCPVDAVALRRGHSSAESPCRNPTYP